MAPVDTAAMPVTVNSVDDERIRPYRHIADARALARTGLFVAEGRWVVQRLLARPQYLTKSVLVTPTAHAALEADLQRAGAHVQIYVVDQQVMDQIVGFNIHRGCLALAARPDVTELSAVSLDGHAQVVVLEGVNNPDNVGGIFRSAAAFAADLVVLGPGCGDPLYRKAIRTSMAATLDVPYVMSGAWPEALETLRGAGFQRLAFTLSPDAVPLEALTRPARVALVFGTEGAGLTAAAVQHCDVQVRVRMTNRVDSLNVTVAASIAMHHLAAAR